MGDPIRGQNPLDNRVSGIPGTHKPLHQDKVAICGEAIYSIYFYFYFNTENPNFLLSGLVCAGPTLALHQGAHIMVFSWQPTGGLSIEHPYMDPKKSCWLVLANPFGVHME